MISFLVLADVLIRAVRQLPAVKFKMKVGMYSIERLDGFSLLYVTCQYILASIKPSDISKELRLITHPVLS